MTLVSLTNQQKTAIKNLIEEYEDDHIPSIKKITQWFYSMDGRIKHGFFLRGLLEKSDEMVTIYRSPKSGESYKTKDRPMYVQGIGFSEDGVNLIKGLRA